MSISIEIMRIIYGPDHAETKDEQYQKDKKVYLSISDKLNTSVRDNPAEMAALSVISHCLFLKRNTVSINKSAEAYSMKQTHSLPLRASKFFPEIQAFLKIIDIICPPDEFDRAVIAKIDVFTQALFSWRDPKYFELKDHFFRLENCSSPLDLLFRGIFYARAKQNVGKVKWIILGIILALIVVFILFKMR